MSFTDQLIATIGERIAQAEHEIEALEGALVALDGRGAAPERRPARTRRSSVPRADPDGASPREPAEVVEAPPVRQSDPAERVAPPVRRGDPIERTTPPPRTPLIERLEALLGDSDEGVSAIALAKQARAPYNEVLEVLRALEAGGAVARAGGRRASLWQLVSEEERIAARAAELERRARASVSST
jgi:hypothetical protein